MSQLNVLLGAGFSRPAGYPLVNDINRYFNRDITDELRKHSSGEWFWKGLADQATAETGGLNYDRIVYPLVLQQILKSFGNVSNYEDLYDFVVKLDRKKFSKYFARARWVYIGRRLIKSKNPVMRVLEWIGFMLFGKKNDSGLGIFESKQYGRILDILNYLIIDLLRQNLADHDLPLPYEGFIKQLKNYDRVRILSLNHDLLTEKLLSQNKISYSNGFDRYGSVLVGDMATNGKRNALPTFQDSFKENLHLLKLHGSDGVFGFHIGEEQGGVLWLNGEIIYFQADYVDKHHVSRIDPNTGAIVQSMNSDVIPKFVTGRDKTRLIEKDLMYSRLFDRFRSELQAPSDLLIIGYSYCDNHINNELKKADKLGTVINVNPSKEYPFNNCDTIRNLKSIDELK